MTGDDRTIIRQSGLFDRDWYLEANPDVSDGGMDPLTHYLRYGEAEGRRPNPFFDPDYYKRAFRWRKPKGALLAHYTRKGWRKGIDPSREFSLRHYMKAYPDVADAGVEPLAHFLAHGMAEGRQRFDAKSGLARAAGASPVDERSLSEDQRQRYDAIRESGLFDDGFYLSHHQDLRGKSLDALAHYVMTGSGEGRWPNPYFDPAWYRRTHMRTDSTLEPLLHYARFGTDPDLMPSLRFDSRAYVTDHPKAADSGMTPLGFHLNRGRKLGYKVKSLVDSKGLTARQRETYNAIKATGLFDEAWYRRAHPDLKDSKLDLLAHYVVAGTDEGRRPNAYFDTGWYATRFLPAASGEADDSDETGDATPHPLVHYAETGWRYGFPPSPEFSGAAYLRENPDVAEAGMNPLKHFLKFGEKEGRRCPTGDGEGTLVPASPDSRLPMEANLRGMVDQPRNALAPRSDSFDSRALHLHWVMPDFARGGGGHMTIFRTLHRLELKGHRITVWINNPNLHESENSAYDDVVKHFRHLKGDVRFIEGDLSHIAGDAVVATDCWSVWPALSATNVHRRFYFVQDFEPYFHPMGTHYLAAEATYRQDLDCLCASPWLADMVREKYGRWATHFWLAADPDIYYPPEEPRRNDVPRIAVYARHFTPRRVVEMAMLALETLARRGVAFEVDFFGAPLDFTVAPFPFRDHGVADAEALADLFRTADVGMVFSATNYSLVPQEMMACGLPLLELDGANTRAIFPDNAVTLAAPDPLAITDALAALLADPDRRAAQAQAALDWVRQFSWDQAADIVEDAIIQRIGENATDRAAAPGAPALIGEKPHASVVIPTLNAGPVLDSVLDAVQAQEAPFAHDVLVIDSGSTDGTLDKVKSRGIRLHQIHKADFNHGDTRNLGVELTDGDFVAFLTHDALPKGRDWLFNIVTALEHFGEQAGGAFGKHLAWWDADPFTRRDMTRHFRGFDQHPVFLTRDSDPERYALDESWRQLLHFYSDNNSCLRRSVWEKVPMRRTKFGEDQLFAHDLIEAGYGRVYAPQAVVWHSHDYGPEETFERTRTESAFFRHFFGYRLMKNAETLEKTLTALNAEDRDYAARHGLSDDVLERRLTNNEARLKGLLAGAEADTTDMF
ncbi:rhamnosyltransferase WsaF family glycosyltransferase [Yunchengibacter salinarum]|uniref:rhamnosyltransferase WsaF family glycosyltransferase n=1 Tax=Yunchengibacter salinarum TaxID=3133399 RepID=UPI0035B5989F